MFSHYLRVANQSTVNIPEQLRSPYFLTPSEVGHFSVDRRRNIHYDRSQLKYYVPRSNVGLELDLSANYWNTVQKEFDISEKMEQMLRWIMHQNFSDVDPRNSVTDFVTTRGTMQQILCSPYHYYPSDSWSICASKLKNTIYFALVETDEKVMQHAYLSERDKQMIAWGYKFEQYMTSNSSYGPPDMSSVTYQLEDFSIVLRSKLNEYSLLYKAEIDGLKSGTSAGFTYNYVELKTSRNSPPYYSDISFLKGKSVKWWAQIFLAGVRDIVCGFRDSNGMVTSVETFSETALTGYGKNYWSPDTCLKFCYSFLTILKEKVVDSDHRIVHKFDFKGGSSLSYQRLISPEKRLQVIPDWYANSFNQRFVY